MGAPSKFRRPSPPQAPVCYARIYRRGSRGSRRVTGRSARTKRRASAAWRLNAAMRRARPTITAGAAGHGVIGSEHGIRGWARMTGSLSVTIRAIRGLCRLRNRENEPGRYFPKSPSSAEFLVSVAGEVSRGARLQAAPADTSRNPRSEPSPRRSRSTVHRLPATGYRRPPHPSIFACASRCFLMLPQTVSHIEKMPGSAIA